MVAHKNMEDFLWTTNRDTTWFTISFTVMILVHSCSPCHRVSGSQFSDYVLAHACHSGPGAVFLHGAGHVYHRRSSYPSYVSYQMTADLTTVQPAIRPFCTSHRTSWR